MQNAITSVPIYLWNRVMGTGEEREEKKRRENKKVPSKAGNDEWP
jgi:hypothetical protein